MNVKSSLAVFAAVASLSFGAFAAQPINNSQAANMQSIGTITVSGTSAAPSDIRDALSAKADKMGASAFRVVELREEGNYHATAEIYK